MGLLLAVILLAVTNQQWVHANRFCSNDPSPPWCANDCSGNGYYLSQDETRCIQCRTCEPGKELDKICGDGQNGDAQCVPCQEGFFSADRARRCTPCRACTNTVELKACERSSDRECGDCLPGYLRSGDRFGDPDACPLRCRDQSPDTPGCREWWREQNGDERGEMDGDVSLKKETVHDYDFECESTPPQCEDDCHGNRLYLGRDGLCKLCLQCQPGYELDKDCGNGRNGDAECRRCEEGTFSVDGRGQCIPCRICVNTEEVTGCESTRDRQCGGCLPGYFQAADGFFPDPDACPNSCAQNPRDTPECIDWWQQQDAIATDVGRTLSHTEPQEVQQPLQTVEEPVVFQKDKSDEKDSQIAKESSATFHHSSYMTGITALASLLVIVVIIVVLAFIIIRIYIKKQKPNGIKDVQGPLLSASGSSTPSVATPDLTGPHSSSRIFKQPQGLQSATSLSNEPPFWNKIHQNHVQGTLQYRIDGQRKNFGRDQPTSGQDEPDSTQPKQNKNRRAGRCQDPLVWRSAGTSAVAPPDGREDTVLYTSDSNGATRSVPEKSEAGTTLRRRSSIVSPTSPDGLQVLRRNSLQLNNLASNGSHTANGRRQRMRSTEGPNEFPYRTEQEQEAALFPGDSSTETRDQETDAINKFNHSGPQDIERGRNDQEKPVPRDVDLNKEASNAGKTIPNMPHQIEEGQSEREPALDNRRKRQTIPSGHQKQRNQHPMTTSLTFTSESPVININLNTSMVRTMHVGDTYNEHNDGTQDALLGTDAGRLDGMEDQSEAEEDTSLMNG